jgi:NAD(P)-dependent dehydrogenase (short-subunit alcohol dehydrogenase family)
MLPLAFVADPAPAPESLRGRFVLVTGACGGLGRAAALACARAGAGVILLGRKVRGLETLYDEVAAVSAPDMQPSIYPMNLEGAQPEHHAQLADTIAREVGRLDGIVHAAARFDGLRPFEQTPPAEWSRALQVNLTAPFLLTRACMPLLRAASDAAIVFVLDDPQRTGKSFWGGYGVAKHGLAGLAEIVHEETERGSIRTHALLPAPMRTALRRMAYFGENTMNLPAPDAAGAAVAWLLGADAGPMRGNVLDLRPADA